METPPSNPPILEYAPRRPNYRRWVRRGIALAVACLAVSAAWRVWPFIEYCYWRFEAKSALSACMQYNVPADRIVHESDPQAAQRLISSGRDYAAIRKPGDAAVIAAYQPQDWIRLNNLVAGCQMEIRVGNKSYEYTYFGSMAAGAPWAIVFLGPLKTGDKEQCVAVMCYWATSGRSGNSLRWSGHLMTPQLDRKPAGRPVLPLAPPGGMSYGFTTLDKAKRLRIYAGQRDPRDPSRVVVHVEADGKAGTLAWEFTKTGELLWADCKGPAFDPEP